MQNSPLKGLSYLSDGFALMLKPGLRRFVFIPVLINTTLFSLLIYFGASEFSALVDRLLPGWLEWLRWILWPLFALSVLLISFYLFTIVANFIGAPFNGLLAEAVENRLTNKPLPAGMSWGTLLKNLPGTLWIEVRKILFFLKWALPIGILFFIPGINLIAPFIWLLFSAWMISLEYTDYPMGNHGIVFVQQRKILRQKRFTALGFGLGALGATMIPIVNFFVMPAAVCGATKMWVELWPDYD